MVEYVLNTTAFSHSDRKILIALYCTTKVWLIGNLEPTECVKVIVYYCHLHITFLL
jgi:hypothetical protein